MMRPEDYAVFDLGSGLRLTGLAAIFAILAVLGLMFFIGYAVGLSQ